MKKLILILALTLIATSSSWAKKANINRSGDTTIVISGGDTLKVADSNVKAAISSAINDTIWDENTAVDPEEYEYADNQAPYRDVAKQWAYTVKEITFSLFVTVVVIVFLSLLFYLLHRRAKYRVIEKAIENDYPLPPSLSGVRTFKSVPQPAATPDAWKSASQPQMPTPPQPQPAGAPQPEPAPMMFYRTNYRAYRSSAILVCIGFCLTMFFAAAEAYPMMALTTIITLLGLGKGFIVYKEQEQDRAYWAWQMQQPTPAQPQRQPEQSQPAPPAQPPVPGSDPSEQR